MDHVAHALQTDRFAAASELQAQHRLLVCAVLDRLEPQPEHRGKQQVTAADEAADVFLVGRFRQLCGRLVGSEQRGTEPLAEFAERQALDLFASAEREIDDGRMRAVRVVRDRGDAHAGDERERDEAPPDDLAELVELRDFFAELFEPAVGANLIQIDDVAGVLFQDSEPSYVPL